MTRPESASVVPPEWCPDPHRWSAPDDESCEDEVREFLVALVHLLKPAAVLETGRGRGHTTRALAEALLPTGKLWSVDRAERPEYGRLSNITYAVADCYEWEPPDDVRFDLAFFDCDYRRRRDEFEHYRPWLRIGTIVAFHDVGPQYGPDGGLTPLLTPGLGISTVVFHTPRGLLLGEVL